MKMGRESSCEEEQRILAKEKEGKWRGWEWGQEDGDGKVDSIRKKIGRKIKILKTHYNKTSK
jgi:hypothetical protein